MSAWLALAGGLSLGIAAAVGWIKWALERGSRIKAEAKMREAQAQAQSTKDALGIATIRANDEERRRIQDAQRFEDIVRDLRRQVYALEEELVKHGDALPTSVVAEGLRNFGLTLEDPPSVDDGPTHGPEDVTPVLGVPRPNGKFPEERKP